MVAVGIDVSKAQSTVAMLNNDGSIRAKPFTMYPYFSRYECFGELPEGS
ncbi:MAG: hypothetical protein QM426_07040 [Euryarchaeota archaeon]|nr:hypothetical protein [Euryarchaeota archaeon]